MCPNESVGAICGQEKKTNFQWYTRLFFPPEELAPRQKLQHNL